MKKLLPDIPGLYAILIFPLLVALRGVEALRCGDTYWHIKAGEVMLERGELLSRDIFSHTAQGKPWIAHEWLAELVMAALYRVGGLTLVALVFLFIAAVACYVMILAARELSDDWSTVIAAALAFPLTLTHLLIRPHAFTWLFSSLTLYLLLIGQRRLWLLPFITALWANLHGGFVIGLFLQGAFLLGGLLDEWPGRARDLWQNALAKHSKALTILALSIIASCINPYGYHLLLFPLLVSSPVFAQGIGEWQPVDLQREWYLRLWVMTMLVLAAVHFRRSSWAWRIIVVFLLYQALGHSRHFSIAGLLTIPWVAMAVQAGKRGRATAVSGAQLVTSRWSGPALALVLLFGLSAANHYRPRFWQEFAEARLSPPVVISPGLAKFLEGGFPGERVLNEYSLGGPLLFSLKNPPFIFIDGRADMYGAEIFGDYLQIATLAPGFEQLLDKYRIDWIIFPKDHHLPRYLEQAPKWQKVYADEEFTVLAISRSTDRL